jgi:hypothetical protein
VKEKQIEIVKPSLTWATAALFALLVLFAGIALFHSAAGAFFRVPQNFNEGWNAYFARAAFLGPLYFPYDAPVTNNYPPLSFYLIGGLSLLGGDPIYLGRLISGLALLVVAVDIHAILRLFGADRLTAAGVAIAFLGLIAIGFPDYVATNDPQWLGHATMVTGLAWFLYGYPRRSAVVGAALVMLAAGLVKHNLLPIPVAVTVWLFLYDRARLLLWIAVCAAGIAVAAVAIGALHGALAFEAILLMKRVFLMAQFVNTLYEYIAPALPLVLFALVCGAWSDRRARLIYLYALIALVWDAYTMTAVGVAYNGILDYYIAVALLTGIAIGRLAGMGRVAALAAVTFPVVVLAANLPKPHRVLESFRKLEADFRQDEALVQAAKGPAMCYTSALCFWAGKPFEYDHFNEQRKMDIDPVYREKFRKKLENHYFAIVQLMRVEYGLPVHHLSHLPDEIVRALLDKYPTRQTSKTGRIYLMPADKP